MPQLNNPSLWRSVFPDHKPDGHKYDRGCAVVFGGAKMTGAARLASEAAMRVGAGLCVVVAPESAASIYRASLPAHIIVEDFEGVRTHLSDPRRKAVLVGPGMGRDIRSLVLAVLAEKRPTVLDADALTAFEGDRGALIDALHADCVLTPHEGEFVRLFPELTGSKSVRAEKAAAMAGCAVLIKGADSVIAAGGRETVLQDEAVPALATAGSGDVLAGIVTGLMAQGMAPFDATCAAAYLHAQAGKCIGRGLVAADLPDLLPRVLKELLSA